jgi:hypothetical protein
MVTPQDVVTDDSIISIVGQKHQMVYGKIKNAVIQMSDGFYYYKDDDTNLVKVRVDGKTKLFRKKSKLIALVDGEYILKQDVVFTTDGIPLNKNHVDTVQLVNGNWTRRAFTVDIEGKYYLVSDPTLVKCFASGTIMHKEDAIKLCNISYPQQHYVSKKMQDKLVVERNTGNFILASHAQLSMDENGDIWSYYNNCSIFHNGYTVFAKFKDPNNPQLNRIDHVSAPHKLLHLFTNVGSQVGMDLLVHKNHLNYFMTTYKEIILAKEAKETLQIKKSLKYSDDGPDENQAKFVQKIPDSFPGKQVLRESPHREPVYSKAFSMTGGLKYTFGVEIETSQGMVPNKEIDEIGALCVGDRSIGSGEYVTPVLQGNAGLLHLKTMCDTIAAHTFVDDRCGIHVHVKNPEVAFDRHFCINAIKLATQIEPELYASCPPTRAPMFKHCHSIMRYKDISEENWKQYLGAFVFGPREVWKKTIDHGAELNPFSMHAYNYGQPGQTKAKTLDPWYGSRYKWINLLHILAASKIQTFEIRLFAGSTSYAKIEQYVLTTMAFVWFVENRSGAINKGNVKLRDVLTEPFLAHNKPEIAHQLLDFYNHRIARFNRDITTMYPAKIPAAIF